MTRSKEQSACSTWSWVSWLVPCLWLGCTSVPAEQDMQGAPEPTAGAPAGPAGGGGAPLPGGGSGSAGTPAAVSSAGGQGGGPAGGSSAAEPTTLAGAGGAAAGTGGAGVTSTGGAGSAGSGSQLPPDGPYLPRCISSPSQVVIVGDSYVNWGTHTFPADLAMQAGETWRLYAIGGSSLGSGGATGFIPDQLELAISEDPEIRAVVMDGGGNDILIPAATFLGADQCTSSPTAGELEVCQMIVQTALDAGRKLIMRAAEAGIRDTIYFFYPEVPKDTFLGGPDPNVILHYALPLAREMCESAVEFTSGRLRCHFVDLVPVFAGKSGVFAAGDIHPNSTGSALMAEAVWNEMKASCVGQKESSGCCEP